jgi:hypothetical protein
MENLAGEGLHSGLRTYFVLQHSTQKSVKLFPATIRKRLANNASCVRFIRAEAPLE